MRSFVTPDAAAAPVGAAVASAAPTTAIAVPRTYPNFEGEITQSDIKMPYLSIVQGVGPKSVMFTPGTVLLGELPLSEAPKSKEPTPRLRVMFVKPTKVYVENLPYDPTPTAPRPRIMRSLAEVKAVGGVTEWVGNVPPSFQPKLTSLTLIRSPEKLDDDSFNIIADGKAYAPAMVSFTKTSYPAAKTLMTDLSLSLKGDPTATLYDLFYAREQKGPNFVWCAHIMRVRDEKPSDALKAIAAKLSGANVEPIEDDEPTPA